MEDSDSATDAAEDAASASLTNSDDAATSEVTSGLSELLTDESAVVTSSETLSSVADCSLVGDDSEGGVDDSGVVSVGSDEDSESEVASLADSDALLESSVADARVVCSATSEVRPSDDFSDADEDSAASVVTPPEDSSPEELASPATVVASMSDELASLAPASDDAGGTEEASEDESAKTSDPWDVASDGRADSPLPSPSVDQIGEAVPLSSVVSDESKETKSDVSLVPDGERDDGSSLNIKPSELKLDTSLAEVTRLWSSIPGDDPDPSSSVEKISTP